MRYFLLFFLRGCDDAEVRTMSGGERCIYHAVLYGLRSRTGPGRTGMRWALMVGPGRLIYGYDFLMGWEDYVWRIFLLPAQEMADGWLERGGWVKAWIER